MSLDIVFISYYEPNAEKNWEELKARFPYALRVDKVNGIPEAFIEAARVSKTSHVWTVDADNSIHPDFDFSFKPEEGEDKYVHLWYAENPINGLQYGYGGIKLFPRKFLRDAEIDPFSVDFTVPFAKEEAGELKIHEEVASYTNFNTDPFSSYRAGFREGAKLQDEIIDFEIALRDYPPESWTEELQNYEKAAYERLRTWIQIAKEGVPYGSYAQLGALDGAEFAQYIAKGREEILCQINSFDFIRTQYVARFGEEPITRQ
jgi:hypothetical protein